ncbi:hypothetical protein AB832_03820 [Flavobacteriaceae bacterium (ex Bugula neritina AB1)]|nr:hypothetical protein AB832_03820 [Flavobacteriaceae bacterium (ex Bugula neritina AB1)]
MTNTPYLNRYRNGEYLQYMKDVLQLVNDASLDTLTTQVGALNPIVDNIDAAFQQSQGSTLTQEIINLDERRDRAIVGLRSTTDGYTYHHDAATASAATALNTNIASHGARIQQLSYQEETATLDSIIADWETDSELTAAVTTLNLSGWLAELKAANAAFTTKYLERVEETAANPSENIPQLRNDATVAYRALTEHIGAHATLGTADGYNTLQDQISVLAGQYNQVVDNRTDGETEDTTETDTTTDDTTEA